MKFEIDKTVTVFFVSVFAVILFLFVRLILSPSLAVLSAFWIGLLTPYIIKRFFMKLFDPLLKMFGKREVS